MIKMGSSFQKKTVPTLEWETGAGHPRTCVAGTDEVGRGCLAGPVVAAAVVLPEKICTETHPWIAEVRDSKQLNAATRERLGFEIENWARAFAVAPVSVEEIDRLNIYHASHLAMTLAVEQLPIAVDHILVDGNALPIAFRGRATAIVEGDSKSIAIACASILAKVWRDKEMVRLDAEYPGYGHAAHKGYSTPQHLAALKSLGATDIHRRTFAPVALALGLTPLGIAIDSQD